MFYVARRPAASGSWYALLVIAACTSTCKSSPPRFKDTEGAAYVGSCDNQGCRLELEGAPRTKLTLTSSGRIVGVCRGDTAPQHCRPLVCKGDAECPPAQGMKHGACVGGLCTEPSNPLKPEDAIMLCLARTGWGDGSPAQIERYALGLNCGSPCRVPGPCLKP